MSHLIHQLPDRCCSACRTWSISGTQLLLRVPSPSPPYPYFLHRSTVVASSLRPTHRQAAMAVTVDNNILRTSDNPALARYLRSLLETDAQCSTQISRHLLTAAETESIPPRIFSVWLSVCDKPHAVVDALSSESVVVRRHALRRAGKWIHSKRFLEIWEALGDTPGIISLMSTLSIAEVKEFGLSLCRASSADSERDVRRARVTDLLRSLSSDQFPDAKFKNPETRRIAKLYLPIVEACDPSTKIAWLENETLPKLRQDDDTKARIIFENTIDVSPSRDSNVRLKSSQLHPTLRQADGTTGVNSEHWHGASKDMLFSVQKLWGVQEMSSQELKSKKVPVDISKNATTLMRRLWRKKCSTKLVLDVSNMLIKIFTKHPDTTKQIAIGPNGFVAYIARIWSRRQSPELWQALQTILQFVRSTAYINDVVNMTEVVRIADRPRFLRLALLQISTFKFDIDVDDDLKHQKHAWPAKLFLNLPSTHAESLLRRLIDVCTHDGIVNYSSAGAESILEHYRRNDPISLLLKISSDEAWVRQTAKDLIDHSKLESIKSREQSERATWVRQALIAAVASRDCGLFGDTLVWARRYSKDPLTVKLLYGSWLHSTEVIDLIAGIPCRTGTRSMDEIREAVDNGNRIMHILTETAYKAVLEPSFKSFDWNHVAKIPALVLARRLSLVHTLQSKSPLEGDIVYEKIWRGTLKTLIEIESTNLDEENEALRWQSMTDMISDDDLLEDFDRAALLPPATVRFLDEYAQKRDELWAQKRLQRYPAVLELPRLFPRGLPIQYLFPRADKENVSLVCQLPYVFKRAEEIVFVDEQVHEVIPSSKEKQAAIASYIDSYETALAYYINAHKSGPERDAAVVKAWNHAVGPLSPRNLQPLQRDRFWHERFSNIGSVPKLSQPILSTTSLAPILPAADDEDAIVEWNPDPSFVKEGKEGEDTAITILDCLLHTEYSIFGSGGLDMTHMWAANSPSCFNEPSKSPTIWTTGRFSQYGGSTKAEGIMAAAMLLVTERIAADSSVLSKPFPYQSDARFPALYLDNDFLERKDVTESIAVDALTAVRRDLPTQPLLNIARILQPKLADPKIGSKVANIYHFFNLLGDTHMPWKFVDLHLDLIFSRPEDSAWHRQLLKKALLNNLTASQAKRAITNILNAIERSYEGEKKAKITTLKQFASLIANTNCVDHATSARALLTLLAKSKHIDVRVAVITGLIEIFHNADAAIKSIIIDGFQTHAIEMAASIDQRQVISEAEWLKAEAEAKAPEPSADLVSPITECFMQLARSKNLDTVDRQIILHKVLLPIVHQWSSNIRRWSRIFLSEHSLHLSHAALEHAMPCQLVGRLFDDHIEHLPKTLLDAYVERNFALQKTRKELQTIEAYNKSSATLRRSEQVKYWRLVWGNADAEFMHERLPKLLCKEWSSKIETPEQRITHEHIEKIVRGIIEYYIVESNVDSTGKQTDAETKTILLQLYVRHIGLDPSVNASIEALRQRYARPIAKDTIRRIDGLRTPAWQRDPQRTPAVLPDPFEMRSWLLPCPGHGILSTETMTAQCLSFAKELRGILLEITSDHRPYAARYKIILDAAKLAKGHCKLRIALDLNAECPQKGSQVTLADMLCLQLVNTLFEQGTKPFDAADIRRGRAVVSKWTQSIDEDIRNMGVTAERGIERAAGSTNYYKWSYEAGQYLWSDASCELPDNFVWNAELTKRRRLEVNELVKRLNSNMTKEERRSYLSNGEYAINTSS